MIKYKPVKFGFNITKDLKVVQFTVSRHPGVITEGEIGLDLLGAKYVAKALTGSRPGETMLHLQPSVSDIEAKKFKQTKFYYNNRVHDVEVVRIHFPADKLSRPSTYQVLKTLQKRFGPEVVGETHWIDAKIHTRTGLIKVLFTPRHRVVEGENPDQFSLLKVT